MEQHQTSATLETGCCSEHHLWVFDGDLYLDPFTAVYCCCAVVSANFISRGRVLLGVKVCWNMD